MRTGSRSEVRPEEVGGGAATGAVALLTVGGAAGAPAAAASCAPSASHAPYTAIYASARRRTDVHKPSSSVPLSASRTAAPHADICSLARMPNFSE